MATISAVKQVPDANGRIAASNRSLFGEKGMYFINLMSSPGTGKVTLVERA